MKRTYSLGMPQMAAGCLSENWLLKELGNLHWERLCESLGTQSQSLVDANGRRLYATFVRVKLDLADNLSAFGEGDKLSLSLNMDRYGNSTILSSVEIASNRTMGIAQLMSTFSFRVQEGENTLAKSQPSKEYDSSVRSLTETPDFLDEYTAIRRIHGKKKLDDGAERYQINPFTESNGANLLYFASYQGIHDFLADRTNLDAFTKSRDIC